jgi:hypothetical protein
MGSRIAVAVALAIANGTSLDGVHVSPFWCLCLVYTLNRVTSD